MQWNEDVLVSGRTVEVTFAVEPDGWLRWSADVDGADMDQIADYAEAVRVREGLPEEATRPSDSAIETEEHRRVFAAERLSQELADRNEDLPEPGPERRAAVEEWLVDHPEVVVGAKLETRRGHGA